VATGNLPPAAAADHYFVDENTTLNVAAPGVLGNDSDADNDPLTAVLVDDVSHGSLALNPDGSFDYTPALDYNGPDDFTYQAYDGQDYSAVTPVTLTVNSAAGPVLVLDIPTPTAVRMDPFPVFAALDYGASSTGDGSSWDQCLIKWSLSRAGGLGPWPAKYRYVDDPRPGHEGVQRDLSYEGRGFNMAWLLTEGTWTITCTVTNPSRNVTPIASAPIVVAANTRTKRYVNSATGVDDTSHGTSAGNPYATLAYAFSRHGSADNYEYVLAGGHVEDRGGSSISSNSYNAYIRWDGVGDKPLLRWTTEGSYPSIVSVHGNSQGQVWEDVRLADASSAATLVHGFDVSGSYCGFVQCEGIGSASGNRLNNFIRPGGPAPTGVMALGCITGATRGYSLVYTSDRTYHHHAVTGCDFGLSTNESVIRTNAPVVKMNVLYSRLTQNGSKSCLRFVAGEYQHAYGCRMHDGEAWLGRVDPSGDHHSDIVRFEANHMSGFASAGANIDVRGSDGSYMTIANNVVTDSTSVPIDVGTEGNGGLHEYIRILCNTINTAHPAAGLKAANHPSIRLNEARANLVVLANPSARLNYGRFVDVGSNGWTAFTDNVYTPKSLTPQNNFAFVDGAGIATLSNWLAQAFVSNEQEVNTAIGADLSPNPATTISTPDSVYDDYYGNARGTTSWAGAVGGTP
jgi:hypothetical protein